MSSTKCPGEKQLSAGEAILQEDCRVRGRCGTGWGRSDDSGSPCGFVDVAAAERFLWEYPPPFLFEVMYTDAFCLFSLKYLLYPIKLANQST